MQRQQVRLLGKKAGRQVLCFRRDDPGCRGEFIATMQDALLFGFVLVLFYLLLYVLYVLQNAKSSKTFEEQKLDQVATKLAAKGLSVYRVDQTLVVVMYVASSYCLACLCLHDKTTNNV